MVVGNVQEVDSVAALVAAVLDATVGKIVLLEGGSPYSFGSSQDSLGYGPSALELNRSVLITSKAGSRVTLNASASAEEPRRQHVTHTHTYSHSHSHTQPATRPVWIRGPRN